MSAPVHAPGRPRDYRGAWRTDAPARAAYAEAAGIGRAIPRAVAAPVDADDAAALVAWAAATGAPLVPRGAGSSMAGGAIGDGVIVDLSRLADAPRVDADARRVRVGPGVRGAAVDAAARAHGLRFPVNPSSWKFATVGGMAACNAAGAQSLGHGAMRPWVTALDVVWADATRATVARGAVAATDGAVRSSGAPAARLVGEVLPAVRAALAAGAPLRRAVRKDSSGYALAEWGASGDLVDLLVGSEGTLALFTGVELALAPVPGGTASVLGVFPVLEAAVAAATQARAAGASACELLDRTFLDVAAEGGAWRAPAGTEAVLLAEVEGVDAAHAADGAQHLRRAFLAAGAHEVTLALTPKAEHALWELRHAASPILARLDPSLKSMQFIEDGAVPPDALPAYVRGVRAALARQQVRGVIFGHAGDAHVHVNPLVDVRRPDWRARVAAILDEVSALAASLGGTLAGEHGDGRLRTPLLAASWAPEARALFAAVKRAADPAGILNPGVKVPLPGQVPLGDVKYDPALPPLPDAARRALDHVAARRAYDADRLALVDALAADGMGTPGQA